MLLLLCNLTREHVLCTSFAGRNYQKMLWVSKPKYLVDLLQQVTISQDDIFSAGVDQHLGVSQFLTEAPK